MKDIKKRKKGKEKEKAPCKHIKLFLIMYDGTKNVMYAHLFYKKEKRNQINE